MPAMMLTLPIGGRFELDTDYIASAIFVSTAAAAVTVPLVQVWHSGRSHSSECRPWGSRGTRRGTARAALPRPGARDATYPVSLLCDECGRRCRGSSRATCVSSLRGAVRRARLHRVLGLDVVVRGRARARQSGAAALARRRPSQGRGRAPPGSRARWPARRGRRSRRGPEWADVVDVRPCHSQGDPPARLRPRRGDRLGSRRGPRGAACAHARAGGRTRPARARAVRLGPPTQRAASLPSRRCRAGCLSSTTS